jgi:hypothetical protein
MTKVAAMVYQKPVIVKMAGFFVVSIATMKLLMHPSAHWF